MRLIFILLLVTATIAHAQPGTEKWLIDLALERSNGLAIQKQKVTRARLDRQKALFTYLPDVYLDATYTHLNNDISFKVPTIQIPLGPDQVLEKSLDPIVLQKQNSFKTNINATMVVFSGMKVPYLASAARHVFNSEQNLLGREEALVIKETMEFHDKLAVINQSLVVLEESRKRLEKQMEFAEKAYRNQLITSYDLSKLRIAQQELKAKEIDLNGQRRIVWAKLHQLTGLPITDIEAISPKLDIWEMPHAIQNTDNRPEIKALEEGIMASKYITRSEASDYLPKVFLFGKKELYENDLSALDPPWYMGVGLKWHLFDGMKNKVDIQKAKLETDILTKKTDEARSLFDLNLTVNMEKLSVATQLIDVANEKADHATEALHIAQREYELGLKSITERLASESDHQIAKMDLILAIYNLREQYLKVLEAVGSLNTHTIQELTNH